MKTSQTKKMSTVICILISLVFTPLLFAETESIFPPPPTNAALVYYQAFLLYQKPDDATYEALSAYGKGKATLTENVAQCIKNNKKSIDFVTQAADLPDCDWGYDYSKGIQLQMPNLAQIRGMCYLLRADAKILAEKCEYKEALNRCLTTKKMAVHAGSDPILISFLVGISINSVANNLAQNILSDMPLSQNSELLEWFKNQLPSIEERFPTVQFAFEAEGAFLLTQMQKGLIEQWAGESEYNAPPCSKERLKKADAEFFEKNKIYYKNYMAENLAALDLPYTQAFAMLKELEDKPSKDTLQNPDASITSFLAPTSWKIYSLDIKNKNLNNVIHTALEIYISFAKTGKLPDKLPSGDFTKDLFSGKPFEYIKTDDGFTLRCQGKDLSSSKEEIYEYKFKVKK